MPPQKSLQLVVDNPNHLQPNLEISIPEELRKWFLAHGFRQEEQCSFYYDDVASVHVNLYLWYSARYQDYAFEYVQRAKLPEVHLWAKLQSTSAPIEINSHPPLEKRRANSHIFINRA